MAKISNLSSKFSLLSITITRTPSDPQPRQDQSPQSPEHDAKLSHGNVQPPCALPFARLSSWGRLPTTANIPE